MKTISLRDSKEVLIYKKTKDSDLSIGLEVCYKNIDGIYCNLGTITDTYQQDGVNLYALNTAMGSYMADELKLIRNQTTIVSNGSKWGGQQPDNIEKLLEVLKYNTIESRFFYKFKTGRNNTEKLLCIAQYQKRIH